MYLKTRIRHYLPVLAAMAATFAVISMVVEKPDYSTALIAIGLGFVAGETIHYLNSKKTGRTTR
ncbi:hypothetical protein C772_02412 [Bhargavaea cecembensis DSE10]|uniref:Uncharacterized protein n=1 Tax=Bhargavaea cecembensis DSE10 TaxID=1235279 RepID=M7NE95_9BACL|nr:hypothetical protein [Bhargavaea cecembensis]EMR05592.1 hypothetical protein C772_02412 [Bhargavaea cecembensis DSE10]